MADQPEAAPARVAVSGQDALLATKLHVPGLQPGFVPRPRLVEALGEGLARQLILVEPLTSRELEVIGMLAAGKSNRAIAGELVVALDTVKKHVSHLLDKLGATNRTEAVARARELGLIP